MLMSGVGGNLVAVQASRLSTALHRVSSPGVLPENAPRGIPNPVKTFFSSGKYFCILVALACLTCL